MTLEQLVPSLDICQQLKAAGFPQDAVFVWIRDNDDQHVSVVERSRPEEQLDLKGEVTVFCAAPTYEELSRHTNGKNAWTVRQLANVALMLHSKEAH